MAIFCPTRTKGKSIARLCPLVVWARLTILKGSPSSWRQMNLLIVPAVSTCVTVDLQQYDAWGDGVKAAVWHGRGDVRIESVPDPPAPDPGQVQIEVIWCGICGTDLHEYMAGPLYIPVKEPHPLTGVLAPVIIGHEMCGRVTAVGRGCDKFAIGDRIAACPIIG